MSIHSNSRRRGGAGVNIGGPAVLQMVGGVLTLNYTGPGSGSCAATYTIVTLACSTDLVRLPCRIPFPRWAAHATQGEPTFISATDCTYTFEWLTEAACPLRTVFANDNCSVTDPLSGQLYDLTPLTALPDMRLAEFYNIYQLFLF